MTNEQNIALVQAYRAALAEGNEGKARRISGQIVEANKGFILNKALKYSRAQTQDDKADAYQAASMGVLRAIRDFDPAKGAFTTHADYHIRDYVQRWAGKTVAVARPRSAKMPAAIAKAAEKFRLLHGREPSAEDLGVTRAQLDDWTSATHFVEVDDHGDDERPRFQLSYDNDDDADYQAKCARVEEAWAAALEEMSPRNRDIAERVFLKGEEVKAVGRLYDLGHSSVVQICKRIEVRLKRALDPTYKPTTDYSPRATAARVARIRETRRNPPSEPPAALSA